MKEGKKYLNVEELFRQKLENAELTPGDAVNSALMRKLSRKEFMRFNPSKFNIFYAGLIVAGIITAGILLFAEPESADEPREMPVQEKTEQISPPAQEMVVTKSIPLAEKEAREEEAFTSEDAGNEAEEPVIVGERKENVIVPAIISGAPLKEIVVARSAKPTTLQSGSDSKAALFMPSALAGCAPLRIQFNNLAGNFTRYSWAFGDGGTSNEKEPDWIYDEEGEYTVMLKTYNEDGKLFTWSVPINVYPKPDAKFEIRPDDAILPIDEIRFVNISAGATGYKWLFGDGDVSDTYEPIHKYQEFGRYDVSLIAYSDKGCSDTLTIKNAFAGSSYSINFPNAFIPNPQGPSGGFHSLKSDESSEIFHPISSGVSDYQLKIFSKTGMLIFESNDINIGWDGYYKGQLCNPGVYIWKVRGNYSNGEPFTKMGDITLLKK